MDVRQLEAAIEQLAELSTGEMAWMGLAGSEHAKPILKWLRQQREITRSQYKLIVPHESGSNTMLAGLQADERRLDDLIGLIENSENRKKAIDEEIELAYRLLQMKRKLNQEQR